VCVSRPEEGTHHQASTGLFGAAAQSARTHSPPNGPRLFGGGGADGGHGNMNGMQGRFGVGGSNSNGAATPGVTKPFGLGRGPRMRR